MGRSQSPRRPTSATDTSTMRCGSTSAGSRQASIRQTERASAHLSHSKHACTHSTPGPITHLRHASAPPAVVSPASKGAEMLQEREAASASQFLAMYDLLTCTLM